MEQLRCVVERITYQNEKNGYSVIKCKANGFSELVTVVGTMPEVHAGSVLTLTGEWTVNPRFGRQFTVSVFKESLPATVYGIEKYLGSGLVKGIGPKFASRIVKLFGAETLTIIDETPEALLRVPGIGALRMKRIRESWAEQKEIQNIMLFLQSHNVSTAHATKIYKTYGNDSIRVVRENPYRLADDIWGIGFRTADTIAQKLGFGKTQAARLRSGLLYTLNRLSEDGHCYALRDQLVKAGSELLDVDASLLDAALVEMIHDGDVKLDHTLGGEPAAVGEEAIYLPPFWVSECGIAKRLKHLASVPSAVQVVTEGLEQRIRAKTGMVYDPVQMKAIQMAVRSKVLILTGGPGTGKTTTTLGIIKAFCSAGASVLLAAPTGRAAKRLSETTGMEAKTLHRLLEVKPPEGYQKNEENPLQGDVLIVDECSMIDTMLMYNLLKAIPDTMTLILVGDVDQLPSVGAGNVLRDLIDSAVFPVIRLTKIFRQAQTSRIIMNAHRINQGRMPDLSNGRQSDFFFLEIEDPEAAAKEVVSLVKDRLPKAYRTRDIQVLTPMQRGVVGAANLNQILQASVNNGSPGLHKGGTEYRLHDKVMQIRNNYDREVFNGDIGTIVKVNTEDRELSVNFDGRTVTYDVSELDELVLAYATTIHKSQGSEYPIVVMPILMTHYVMLQRNLIYTGVTRAKKVIVIVGTKKALTTAIRNVTVNKRNTMLCERLKQPL
ncbi:MAG: ATP-dependent RecD-like DNA helicase [Oscillospiraceae bacterium]|nr:ATP-dependent RecD-like DNA helicase [Oscillospiraceae bacterium]